MDWFILGWEKGTSHWVRLPSVKEGFRTPQRDCRFTLMCHKDTISHWYDLGTRWAWLSWHSQTISDSECGYDIQLKRGIPLMTGQIQHVSFSEARCLGYKGMHRYPLSTEFTSFILTSASIYLCSHSCPSLTNSFCIHVEHKCLEHLWSCRWRHSCGTLCDQGRRFTLTMGKIYECFRQSTFGPPLPGPSTQAIRSMEPR